MEALRAEFEEHGFCRVPQLLDEDAVEKCRYLFDQAVFAPTEVLARSYQKQADGSKYYYNDGSGHKGNPELHQAFHAAHPEIAKNVAAILGSQNLWYCDHEVWYKTGGTTRPTPLHQDTGVLPGRGMHMANLWIAFEPFTPKENALGVVPGSHKGPLYKSPTVGNERAKGPSPKTVGDYAMVVPGQEAAAPPKIYSKPTPIGVGMPSEDVGPKTPEEKQAMRAEFKAMPTMPRDLTTESYDLSRGDVLLLHPHSIHGNGPLSEEHPERHTLVIRVFGDDCVYQPIPGVRFPGIEEGVHFSQANPEYFKIFGEKPPGPAPSARL